MKLSPEASAALERLRSRLTVSGEQMWASGPEEIQQHADDKTITAFEMLRLFPPGHDAEITPERLIACGFAQHPFASHAYVCRPGDLNGLKYKFHGESPIWLLPWNDSSMDESSPTNMGEVWNLMERCGLEVKHA